MSRHLKIWLPAIRAGSGADVFVERLAAALSARYVEVIVTWFSHRYELFPDLLRRVPSPAGVDIIHANAAQAFAFKRQGIPLVATELHYLLDPDYRPYKSLAQHLYHRLLIGKYLERSFTAADAITAISDFTADVLVRVPKVEVSRTIPLWIDMGLFSPAKALEASVGGKPFRLLFVGNNSRRKGADVLPELAKRLGADYEIRCTAGLRQYMQATGVENIKVLGRLSEQELVNEYQRCDAVLVPSRYEGFGYAALEAMACAKPVVGFACGAVREVLGKDGEAFLADVDDVEGLAGRCRALAADGVLRRKIGESGRLRAAVAFSEESAISAYLELYQGLVRETRGLL